MCLNNLSIKHIPFYFTVDLNLHCVPNCLFVDFVLFCGAHVIFLKLCNKLQASPIVQELERAIKMWTIWRQ